MVRRALSIFLIAILIFAAGIASAIQIPYPVYGYIKDSGGNPVGGVTVTVKEVTTGQTKTDVTDKLGRYSVTMDNYRDGDKIEITANDAVAVRTIEVQTGGIQVDLRVAPPAEMSGWMTEQTITGLPNWVLVVGALSSSSVGLTARFLRNRRHRSMDKTIEYIKQNV